MARVPLARGESPRVLVTLDAANAYCREVLAGIVRYSRVHGPWVLLFHQIDTPLPDPDDFHWHAALGLYYTRDAADSVCIRGQPCVNISSARLTPPIPTVTPDNALVAERAAEHFLDRGFEHFAYFGPTGRPYSDQRRDAFVAALARRNFTCSCFPGKPIPLGPGRTFIPPGVVEWIKTLPRPIGVLVAEDLHAWMFLGKCLDAGIKVPEEVAVVGVNNDEVFCEAADVPLSSVGLNAQRIGYEAAALLARMLAGEAVPADTLQLVEPGEVITRQSSDILAIEDPFIAAALRVIRLQACDGLTVGEILREVPVNRRWLERRFRELLGRSPHEEIMRQRLARAVVLLRSSDLTLPEIAVKCGFGQAPHFSSLFRRAMGCPPGAFRRTHGMPPMTPPRLPARGSDQSKNPDNHH